MEAGRHRFRPILMTTMTTISGLIPMALGNSKMIGMPYAPLGRTIIGGLLAATVLTLVIVPLLYALLDDLRTHLKGIARSAAPADAGERPPAGTALAAEAPRTGV
jgi:HAE1 family hydrophobic/amphiphilic exporter-1